MERLGEKIKVVMKRKDISAAELSRRTGLSESHISRLVKGQFKNPRLDTLQLLADGMEVSLAELLADDINVFFPGDWKDLSENDRRIILDMILSMKKNRNT